MTLKEKFKLIEDNSITWSAFYDTQVQIADDYAIEFVRWYFDYVNEKDYYLKVLNEFKKEKGL